MAFIGNIDFENVKPADDFEALPAGKYTCVISASEMKQTKAGTGEYLQLTLTVIDGEYEHRKLFDRLNLINPNATAVDIAKRALASIGQAVGVWPPQDSAELHDIPLEARVEVEQERDPVTKVITRTNNVIKGYSAISGSVQKPVAQPSATPAVPKSAAPWAKK